MTAPLPTVVKTTAIVMSVALNSDANQLVSSVADGAGLRFRQYPTADRLLSSSPQNHVGCILVEQATADAQSCVLLNRLRTAFPQMPVVLLSDVCSTSVAVELMRNGAFSVIQFPLERLALQDLLRDACQLSADTHSACEETSQVRMRMQEATGKELAVLDLVMAGRKNKDIADELGITVRAVEDRRIRLMKKLQVDSLAELVELAVVHRRAKREERLSGRLFVRNTQPRRFVRGVEVWQPSPDGGQLRLAQCAYRDADAMANISHDLVFASDEGLPGDVWKTRAPVFYRHLTAGPFRRREAAAASGLTTGIGFPIFAGQKVQSVVLLLLDGGESLKTVVEHWKFSTESGCYKLFGGVYSNCERLRRLSEHVHFPAGQGLPGAIAMRRLPYLGTRFADDSNSVRGVAIAAEQLHSGLGLPLTDSDAVSDDVLLLFNSESTPLFRLLQVWHPTENLSSARLVSESLDGERTLQSRCGWTLPPDASSLLPGLRDHRQPQVIAESETLSALAADHRTFAGTRGIAIPTYRRGQLVAISVLMD